MIAIIKYNAGNIQSVENAVRKLGYECIVSDDKDVLKNATKVIFPGVGAAATAMQYLTEKGLDIFIKNLQQPFLGICLGLQLMCKYSEEGDVACLGIFDTNVKRFPPDDKVPHIGWNNFDTITGHLFDGVSKEDDVYFVHSYYAECCKETIATCQYIKPFSAALHKNNFYATQFHPEKSAAVGAQILNNFLALK